MKKITKLIELDAETWDALINKWVLSERERAMMHRFLVDAHSPFDIGEEFNYSESNVKRILDKWQAVIYRHL